MLSRTGLGIVDLVSECASMQHRNDDLFDQLGRWLTGSEPPTGALGRLLTEACHRHAEHAALWLSRRPSIPVEAELPGGRAAISDTAGYRDEVVQLRSDAVRLRLAIDRELDRPTHRVIDLVDRDLESITQRIDELI